MYGNIAWTVTTTFVGIVPLVDIIIDSKLTCELAQISSSLCGVFFLLCYTVVPAYLERIFERTRLLSRSVSGDYADGGTTYRQGLLQAGVNLSEELPISSQENNRGPNERVMSAEKGTVPSPLMPPAVGTDGVLGEGRPIEDGGRAAAGKEGSRSGSGLLVGFPRRSGP